MIAATAIPRPVVAAALALLLSVARPAPASAQKAPPPAAGAHTLSLQDAIRAAARESDALHIVRAAVRRAAGQQQQARSQRLPQLNSSVGYSRALLSQFASLAGAGPPADTGVRKPQSLCTPAIPVNATPEQRAAALAKAATCPPVQGIDFSRVGFGARNTYTVGLNFSQNLYSGGRIGGQNTAADAVRRTAEIEVASQRAQLAFNVTQAYFDAVLADRLVSIADTTLAQTDELLRQTQIARQVGTLSEFDLLRATVTRDNQRPVVIARRGDREVAYLRLRQLVNLPLDETLSLTTSLDEPAAVSRAIAANAGDVATGIDPEAPLPVADTATAGRAPVRESEEAVRAQEGLLRVARSERRPSLSLTSGYQRLFFPTAAFPSLNRYAENWTIGGSLGLSLFNGGRVAGQEQAAQANLDEARARLAQTRDVAQLDTRVALNQLQSAEAGFTASRGTAQLAQRAYAIDQLRFREGISTQTDLTQSRLLLEQAMANQAQSARDFAVASARVALIRDLPVNAQALASSSLRGAQEQLTSQSRARPSGAEPAGAGQFGSTQP